MKQHQQLAMNKHYPLPTDAISKMDLNYSPGLGRYGLQNGKSHG